MAITIDRDKLRDSLRTMRADQLHLILSDVVGWLPPSKLAKLAKEHFGGWERFQPSATGRAGLLAKVREFSKASLAREYYESFDVNSKNCTEKSAGTRTWIAKCRQLLDDCVVAADKAKTAETCDAFEALFALLQQLNCDPDAIIFFADEGGAYEVGVDWRKVLSAWFSCLASLVSPDEYAHRVVEMVGRFVEYDRDHCLAQAACHGSAAQRDALAARTTWKKMRSKR